MTYMRSVALIAIVAGTLVFLVACRKNQDAAGPPLYSPLAKATHETHARHEQAVDAGEVGPSTEIPAVFWSAPIRHLNPVKVYRHKGNFVVVQKTSDSIEEGLYIYNPISSYFPRSGDDGFVVFTPLGGDGFEFQFKRKVEN